MGHIRGHIRPIKSNQDGFPINRILGEKLAMSILKFADLGWVQDPNFAIGPVEPPLMGLRIVYAKGETFDVAGWTIDLDRVQLGAAIPNLETRPGALEFDPGIRSSQGILAALQVIFPFANEGVEIVLPIPCLWLILLSRRLNSVARAPESVARRQPDCTA